MYRAFVTQLIITPGRKHERAPSSPLSNYEFSCGYDVRGYLVEHVSLGVASRVRLSYTRGDTTCTGIFAAAFVVWTPSSATSFSLSFPPSLLSFLSSSLSLSLSFTLSFPDEAIRGFRLTWRPKHRGRRNIPLSCLNFATWSEDSLPTTPQPLCTRDLSSVFLVSLPLLSLFLSAIFTAR